MIGIFNFVVPAGCGINATALPSSVRVLFDCRQRASSFDDQSVMCGQPVLLDAEGLLALPASAALSLVAPIFVEYHPTLASVSVEDFRQAAAEPSVRGKLVLVTSDMDFASSLLGSSAAPCAIALKASEAAGPASTETAGVILDHGLRLFGSEAPPLGVWGGIATPEAAAAFLATGASFVIIEHLHWLTSEIMLPEETQQRLRSLKLDSSSVITAGVGVQWRFFDKGNSKAVRTLKNLLAQRDQESVLPGTALALSVDASNLSVSSLSSDELTPLGIDAAFAATFVERFGVDTRAALAGFTAKALECWGNAPDVYQDFLNGQIVSDLGVRFPIIQGGMSWISDSLDFATAVADAGALPTLAVGMRSPADMDRDFSGAAEVMQGKPYAMNVLVLDENPRRDGQLAWLEEKRPPFVVVAAGAPAFAGEMRRKGLEVIYLASDIGLLRMAAEAGIRFVVLEGSEAGGHVGRLTMLTLAQAALELRRVEPKLLEGVHIVLAGGISDGPSALRAALLGADAVQMGTAYLASLEIVTTGALSEVFQKNILSAKFAGTCITGESVGLRVRALETPKVRAICELERHKACGGVEEDAFRHELESLSTGSLLVAAKGVKAPGGAPLSVETCLAEGQFMSGAVAANLTRVRTLAEIHNSFANPRVSAAPKPHQPSRTSSSRERIAITGMALANSLGEEVAAVIEASLAGQSGIGIVPKDRWDHSRYYTPGQAGQGSAYTDVGAFMHLALPRKALGVSPQDYRTMSMSTKLTLFLARKAIESSGLAQSLVPGSRVAVLTSQNSAEVASTVRGGIFNTYADEIGEIAWRAGELTTEQHSAVVCELRKEGLAVDDTTLIGRLNCTASGHICNMYGFGGPSYSVGAACASSLIALYNAVMLIRAGVIDAAVVGGGEELLTPVHYLEFSALRALAGIEAKLRAPAEYSRPFDRDRDGFVLGEGGAVVVLERESIARNRGANIHAFITGVGACTNHQGIVESVAESQMVALAASYSDAGYGLDEVDLVECHGTGTIQGDREEVRALASMLSGNPKGSPTVLASFKSQIGHTLGASGVSSLIRGIGAMRRGVLPPTNNFVNSDSSFDIEAAGFRVLQKAEPWPMRNGRSRRMQVNAFGFGGACLVVQVEAPAGVPDIPCKLPESQESPKRPGVSFLTASVDGSECRLGLVGSPSGVVDLIRTSAAEGMPFASLARLARKGIFLAPADEPAQPLAFIFSGQGSFYRGMGRDLAGVYPAVDKALDRLAACAGYDLKTLLFDTDEETLRDTRWQQPALFAFEYALACQLLDLGVKPTAVAGHSLGEFAALTVAGVLTPEDAFAVVDMRARCMAKAASLAEAPGIMAAIGLPVDVLQWKLGKYPGVVITNYNTPKQVVVGGEESSVRALVEEVKSKGQQATVLKVNMAFHSPVMQVIRNEFEDFLAGISFKSPVIPVLSNVSKGPFPDDPSEIRKTVVEHLEHPVHWTQNVYFLWSELGIRRFVEIGPDAVLGGMVRDICDEAQTVRTASRESEEQAFATALANLYAWGDLTPPSPPALLDLGGNGAPSPVPTASKVKTVDSELVATGPDVLERTIRIIMDATGYERDEILPDMDLRQDLAIRSSRLPVIMDAAERAFSLSFRVEDFIGVHTVRQMAEHIETLLAGGGGKPKAFEDVLNQGSSNSAAIKNLRTGLLPITRYEAGEVPLTGGQPCEIAGLAGKTAWVSGLAQSTTVEEMAQALGDAFGFIPDTGEVGQTIATMRPACFVLVLEAEVVGPESVDAFLLSSFNRLKEFVSSPNRKICVVVMREAAHGTPERMAFEGVLGMLLTLAQEYESLTWRALRVGDGVSLSQAVASALSTSGPVERLVRADGVSTPLYLPKSLTMVCEGKRALGSGDVVLVSAGAKGVTFRLLEVLAPIGPRFVLLGRSSLGVVEAEAVARLKFLGADAEYMRCDVADRSSVEQVVADIASRMGRVDGFIHGAGILRDKFLSMMSEEDFSSVYQVKLGGLRNIFDAAGPHGLRFGIAFSSVAAWQGNVGQSNYCCANRAMASLLEGVAGESFQGKVLWLPPIAGVGMADGSDIREMMEHKGLGDAYVHIDELAPLVAREVACPEGSGPSVLIARYMPQMATVEPLLAPATDLEAGLDLPVDNAPMLDSASLTGLMPWKAVCARRISHDRDLWLPEHRPYKTLHAPLFSAVMVVETFCEAAVTLFPYLAPVGLRNLRFLDILPCSAGQHRDLVIHVAHIGSEGPLVMVDARLESEDLSPKGRAMGRFSTNFEGCVVLSGDRTPVSLPLCFGTNNAIPLSSIAGEEELQHLYETLTGQTGRYRVIQTVLGTDPDGIVGTMRYCLSSDVHGTSAPLCTAPYLLEGLMQLVLFHGLMRGETQSQRLLPVGIGSVRFARLCEDGELLTLKACRCECSPSMQRWAACGLDAQGNLVMSVEGLVMSALTEPLGE